MLLVIRCIVWDLYVKSQVSQSGPKVIDDQGHVVQRLLVQTLKIIHLNQLRRKVIR